jgi:competence protein ComEC
MAYRAHFLSVGCADCTIFEADDYIVMIDCGYRRIGQNVIRPISILNYLKNTIGKPYVNLLIISHPHHDHYLGIGELIGKVNVQEVWGTPYKRREGDPSLSYDEWSEYINFIETLVPSHQHRFVCYKGARKNFDKLEFIVLGPRHNINQYETRDVHDACLVIWVSTPTNQFIICGDSSDYELSQIIKDWNMSSCTILRASHHGSINGANIDFIKAVSPRDTVISTQSGIIDNIPNYVAIKRYQSHSQSVFRTDLNGTLVAPI